MEGIIIRYCPRPLLHVGGILKIENTENDKTYHPMPDWGRRGGAPEKYPGPAQRGEVKTIIKRKLTPLVVILVALIVVPVAYALYPAIEVVTELTVKEPLSLASANVYIATVPGSCTLNRQSPVSASCAISGFAGETVEVTLVVLNAGQSDILLSVWTETSSPDVTESQASFCEPLQPCTPDSGFVRAVSPSMVIVHFAISSSAAPGPVSLLVLIVR